MNQYIYDPTDALLYAAAQNAGQPELDLYNNADDTFVPSKKFMMRMKRLLRKAEREDEWADWHPFFVQLKRILAVVMIVLSISFVFAMSIGAVRDAIWKTIVEWYENSISIQYVNEDNEPTLTEILEYKEPTQGLEGYERYEMLRNALVFNIEYESESVLITYQQSLLNDSEVKLSNNNSELHTTDVSGHPGMYVEYTTNGVEQITLMWNDGVYRYIVGGNTTLKELLKIAESVK